MLSDTLWDMDRLAKFIRDVAEIDPAEDDKLWVLCQTLYHDKRLKGRKVIIFTEYTSTALSEGLNLQDAACLNGSWTDGDAPIGVNPRLVTWLSLG